MTKNQRQKANTIDIISDIPWSTHLCLFYKNKKELIEILVPYFKAGLRNNEFCLWITSNPINEKEAQEIMRKSISGFDKYLKNGQIEIIPHNKWYLKNGIFNSQRVLNLWAEKLNQKIANGYEGMRIAGNIAWIERRNWKKFSEYEKKVNNQIHKHKMISICTYSLDKCEECELIDVSCNHHFSLIKCKGKWKIFENSEHQQLKNVKDELRESELKFRLSVELANDGIVLADSQGNIVLWNKGAKDIFGYREEEVLGKSLNMLVPEKYRESYLKIFNDLKLVGRYHTLTRLVELQGLKKNGSEVPLEASFISWTIGKNRYFCSIVRDVTERKKVEEQIKVSLKEKDLLLKEIHHRVKNNLEIISSLLDLNILRTHDQDVIDLFTDARAKIYTIALIHSQLYQSERFDQINMSSHIQELVDYLIQIYIKREIQITPIIEYKDVYLSIIQAVPCAIALQELVTNAFKHAFKEGQSGIVEISVNKLGNDTIFIRVKDNGIGLPEEIDIYKTESMGLKLVRNLIQKQLRGEIQVKRDNGTEFTIKFKILR